MKRGRCVLLALVAAAFVAVAPGAAAGRTAMAQQAGPAIDQALLRLWPEYDDPGLLVIFSGDLTGAEALPVELTFAMPAGARQIQATYLNEAAVLINRNYTLDAGRLTYTVPLPNFHLEFYVDRPAPAEVREIVYGFEAPYPISGLSVRVRQPARASGFSIAPGHESTETAEDGLTDYVLSRANLAAGDRLDITIRYSKPDSSPSFPGLVVTAPVSQPEAKEPPAWLYVLIGAAAAGIVALAAVYFVVLRRLRPGAVQPVSRKSVARKTSQPAEGAAEAADDFCRKCGARYRAGDRFCAQCGAARHTQR